MKYILLCSMLCLAIFQLKAQNPQRNIRFKTFPEDSVNFPLNEGYYLIEDSCAQIIRYAHFHIEERKFFGKFKDVSKLDPNLVVSEGNYTNDGIKDGDFTSHYLNGKLQSKGKFKNGKYDGRWEMYYDNGKPELTFEATDGDCRIIDAWKADGTQTVTNGNGPYVSDMGTLYWKGKLLNGKPDGTWNMVGTDDASNTSLASEHFKKGQFRNGSRGDVEYTDASHIILVSTYKLPFVNAEIMGISPEPCNGIKRKHVISAQYVNGGQNFAAAIGDAVSAYFSRINLRTLNLTIVIDGEVSEKGTLIEMKSPELNRSDIARGIMLQLRSLPVLQPATVDGKPVKQKFSISFLIHDGYYQLRYTFFPVEID